MRVLADTSAIVAALRSGQSARSLLDDAISGGEVGVIAPVRLETARGARNAAEASELLAVLAHERTPDVSAAAWHRAEETLIELSSLPGRRHRAVSTTDLLLAAVAEEVGMTVLHRDRDFELIASLTGQPVRWYGGPA